MSLMVYRYFKTLKLSNQIYITNYKSFGESAHIEIT